MNILISVIIVAVAAYLFMTLKWDCMRCKSARFMSDNKGVEEFCGQALCDEANKYN